MRRLGFSAVLLLCLACGSDGDDPAGPPAARAFLFALDVPPVAGRTFTAVISDPGVLARVEAQLQLPPAQRGLHVSGEIARGDGGHNTGWSWHLLPGRWDLVENSIELCDGTPEMVEKDLDYWVDTVGRFCPWSSYVAREL